MSNSRFRVIASDDSQAAPVSIASETFADGQFRVRLTPASLLKSNMTYTVSISDAITDPSGNKMTLPVTTNFTTVDYTEPRIVGTTPTVDQAVGDGITFYLRFNKAIDASVFASGGSGVLTLQQLDHNHGVPIGSPLPVSVFVDPKSASTLVVAPVGVALQPASYYRITENGARDTLSPPNVQTTLQTFDFFSADHVKPVVTIDAPAASTKLTAGVDYMASVSIVDEGTTHPSNDIAYVQWFDATGKALTRVTSAPYGYVLRAAAGVTSVTLKASAVDLSGNASDLAAQTWEVTPNLPPQNIVITVPPSAYVGRTVALSATFDEDGLAVTSALTVTGKHRDGTPYALDATRVHRISAQPIRRNTVSDPWPAVQYTVDLPADLKEADALQFALTLTDADNQPASKTASVDILADANPPLITAMLPAGETHYKFGDPARNHYRAQVSVTDAESGVAHVTFVIDAHTTDVNFGSAGSSYANGVYTFFTDVDVAAKNVDTRIHITATVFDYDGNQSAQTTDVIYESVNDGTAPFGSWMTPLDGALVAKGNVTLLLRVHAVDDIHVDTVTFDSALFSSVAADRLANDIFEKSVTFDTPADGSSFVINATISDSGHQTVLPITIDSIVPDIDLATDGQINNGNAATFANKSVRIHGAGKKLYISVPVTLQNLIVADGAVAGNPDGTKIDLTVTDRLYVDGASAIDTTGKGYLGGWATHESGGQNAMANGLTLNNAPGAAPAASGSFFASGSYAGIAGVDSGATTNATYGSITNPVDLGSGGSGCLTVCAGGNGGGAVVIAGGSGANDKSRFVIAGAIRADGQGGVGIAGAGSGGSINLHARALVAGWATGITANGGDDDAASNTSRGGGGGRIAAVISERWDLDPSQPVLQARGGRNESKTEGRAFLDAGAGTIFVQKPGEANGELLVSSFDERHANTLHLTRSTPLSGILNFDSIAVGPRALARFDADFTASNVTTDPTAVLLHPTDLPEVNLVSVPAAGTAFVQGSTLTLTYSAQSNAGVGEVRATLAPAADLALPSFDYPASIATTPANVNVPNNATPGAATLKLRVTDRAGRTAETPATSYSIVANAGPAITQFDVAPASLQTYAGHPITITAAASDDLNVTSLTLTSSTGTIAPVTPSPDPATHGLTATFVVTIPPTIPSGTVVALTLTATDGSGVNTAQTKSVTILHDANPPAATITAPSAAAVFVEGSSIAVSATIVDAEVSVKQASASIDGVSVAMTQDAQHPTTWTGTLAAPDVDGAADVPKTITVTASDFENNAAAPATVSINVRPIIDALAPTVTWTCATPGAMYPSAAIAKLQVLATPASGDSITGVTMTITDTAGTRTVPMTSAGAGSYTYDYTLPAVTTDTSVTLRAVATSLGGKNSGLPGSLIIIAPGPNVVTFGANATITAADTTNEGKTVLVTGGKLTIAGKHTFARLAVLNGATVTELPTDIATINRLDVAATAVFVACGGSIDVTGTGFLPGRTWNNTTTGASTGSAAGSHGATGGFDTFNTVVAAPYGSLYDPNEPGGGGATGSVDGRAGGGIVRIQSPSIQLDGKIIATGGGGQSTAAGAGGSIRIDTGTIYGPGEVRADGGSSTLLGGGGGRVAIRYTGAAGMALNRSRISAAGGLGGTTNRLGNAGTVYLSQVDGTGAKVSDELIVDNGTTGFNGFTPLVNLGTGTITAVNGNVLTLSATVPDWVAGSSIEIVGAVTYEIASSTSTTVTVIVPSGQTLNAPVGSTYRGSSRIAAITVGANSKLQTAALRGDDMTLAGEFDTTEVRGHNLTLKSAAVRQTPTTAVTTNSLRIIATGTLSVDAASVIDATGRGYLPGRTWNNTTTGASTGSAAGSHGGTGGFDTFNTVVAAPYGSLYDPNEPGGGGPASGVDGRIGGGIVRIQSPLIQLDGKITATGSGGQAVAAGAGGSIRIDTNAISGSGEVHADGGGAPTFLGGGGGRIAIYYAGATGMTLSRARITAAGGAGRTGSENGTAGTVYLRQLDGAGAKVTDELIIDNGTVPRTAFTPLVDIGTGTITAVNGNVLTLSAAVPDWVAGSSIEILDASGIVIATYEIASSTTTSVTVIVPSGQTLNAPVGSAYRGSPKIFTFTVGANGTLSTPALHGDDMTLSGEIDTTEIRARNLTLKSAAIRQTPTTATKTNTLHVVVTGTLSVDAASVIDATGRGYLPGRTWNNTTTGGSSSGAAGSHGGTGGTDGGVPAVPYGSLYDPIEPGSGGELNGGGVIGIQASSVLLDGQVLATGGGFPSQNFVCGAGGSIRIDAATISGIGLVRADGGSSAYLGGGGGRVAIYYTGSSGLALTRTKITAAGGAGGSSLRSGAPGTVYLRQLDGAGAKVTDELIIDNGTVLRTAFTPLVDLGTGTITAVNGNVLTLSAAVPAWVAGSSIEILDANGIVIATYEIASSTTTSVTVIVPSGQTLNAPVGSAYRGSSKIATVTVGANGTLSTPALHGDDMTFSGELVTTEIRARNLTLKSAAIRQTPTTAAKTNTLHIVATGTLSVDAASVIDAVGRGYLPGRTFNNTTTGGSGSGAAGSHGGTGGTDGGVPAVPYGSLYDPIEPGSGAELNGGGVIGIQASSVLLDGQILATGGSFASQLFNCGAGGSIRIDAATISGAGAVHADGGFSAYLGGGGGRVAIYYTGSSGLALTRAKITAAGGAGGSSIRSGAPGTVYLKRNDQANGELIVDNGTLATSKTTPLTSVRSGVITGVSSSTGGAADTIADSSAAFPVPNLLTGNRVYINGDKSVLWPARSNTATALTLDISANALTAQVGQAYSGLYRFDTLRLRNAKLVSVDAVESLTPIDKDGVSTITANPDVTIAATPPPSSTTKTSAPAPPTVTNVAPPAMLASIALASSIVEGGSSVNATIVLSGPAPAGGASIAFSTSNALLATVPAEVVVPEGATTVAFTIGTAETGSSSAVTITGIYGSTQSATLTILPRSSSSARSPARVANSSPAAQRKTSSDSHQPIARGAGK